MADFQEMDDKKYRNYDIEAKYNLENLNNTDAIGYDNLLERGGAQTPQENADLAQESALDKLMADYWLNKRGEYKETNNLLKNIADIFDDPEKSEVPVDVLKMEQDVGKTDQAVIFGHDYRALSDLDNATARAIQKNKNGLSSELKKYNWRDKDCPNYHLTQIPDYFDTFDVRKPAKDRVEDTLSAILNECFAYRKNLEKDMSRRELIAFDKTLSHYLQSPNIMARLRKEVNADFDQMDEGRDIYELSVAS